MSNKQHHIELWIWLAEHPNKTKVQWPKWTSNKGHLYSNEYCFACDECDNCNDCPIQWNTIQCTNNTSIYYKYMDSNNCLDRIFFATLIAEAWED